MIKIIEHGARKERRCENCGCLFSFEAIDVETGYATGISGLENYKMPYKFVSCPECKRKIIVAGV